MLDFANRAFEFDVALKVLTPRDGPLVEILNDIGVPTEVVPAPPALLRASQRQGRLASLVGAVVGLPLWSRRLARHSHFREADVIYTVGYKPHLAVALARRHPAVWHLHEFPPVSTEAFWKWMARRIPDRLIANSQAVGEAWADRRIDGSTDWGPGQPSDTGVGAGELRVARIPPAHRSPLTGGGRVVVIPNGVNLDRFKPAECTFWIHDELGIPHEHRLIGMPAVFARWKGQIDVMEAFRQIAAEFPDVHLVIVGGSIYDTVAEREYGEELKRTTGEFETMSGERLAGGPGPPSDAAAGADESSGHSAQRTAYSVAQSRTHMLPFQPKIERAYPEFDLTVHYSLRPEPFGRVIVESMACGVPVIAAAEGGPVEILGGGIGPRREAGWLAAPRDPAALAAIFRSALSLPRDVLRSIGEAGRHRAEDYYSARRFAREVAGVLRET